MNNLPYGLMEALVADHQRELQEFASRRRVLRRRRIEPAVDDRVIYDVPPDIADRTRPDTEPGTGSVPAAA
jgi:hypothetical protein